MSNTSDATQVAPQTAKQQSQRKLISKFAERFAIDQSKLMDILKATAFKQRNGQEPTNEQMAALLVVADQYGLNPFTKEIYAFPDQNNGIVPVVGVDGWLRITNNHPQFDGMEFRFSETTVQLNGLNEPIYEWIECIIHRKDRTRSTPIREYLSELYRPPVTKSGNNGPYTIKGPWQTHPRRFARHKVIIQAARVVFGYSGIYDEDEADRIIEANQGFSSNKPTSIQFDSSTQSTAAIEAPKQPDPLMADLAAIDMETDGVEDAEFSIPVEDTQDSETQAAPLNAVFNTEFGEISAKSKNMIDQMIQFTVDTKSWKTTMDSFHERYAGPELDYALDELMKAQQKLSTH